MQVFISHSIENKPEFENIADALEAAGISYWNPAEVKAGGSLREQLRAAVENCAVCVFVATQSSIRSSWCGAELGAFWRQESTSLFTWPRHRCPKMSFRLYCTVMSGNGR